MIVTDPANWRERRGSWPYEATDNPLAAGAAHILAIAADQAWADARSSRQVIQIPYRPDASVGQTILVKLGDNGGFFGRIGAVEHIIDPPQAITRLEIEVAQ